MDEAHVLGEVGERPVGTRRDLRIERPGPHRVAEPPGTDPETLDEAIHARTLRAVSALPRTDRRPGQTLTELQAGQLVPFGGDRVAVVSGDLAAAFRAGDRLV